MSDRMPGLDDGETTAFAGLEGVIAELRTEVAVSEPWRTAVAARIHEEARGGRRSALGWHIRPPVAVAAALAIAVLGAAAGATVALGIAHETGTSESAAPIAAAATPATLDPSLGVRFAVMAAGVKHVSLVGDFNGWDPSASPLTLARDGVTWSILLPLGAGRHTYAFVIDGQVVADPSAPPSVDEDFGTPSSFVLVNNSDLAHR